MKNKLWRGFLLAGFLCLSLDLVSQTQTLANDYGVHAAQQSSTYDQYMQLGYTQTIRRNYRRALGYFQQALKVRPDDQDAKAAIRNVSNYIEQSSSLISFSPGRPGRRRGAASRGSCFLNSQYAVPLVPTDYEAQLTTSQHPTFLFYVPETAQPIQGLEFVLREEESIETVYRKTFKPVQQGGIVSITIPSDEPSLKAGKKYIWGFSMICDFLNRDQDLYEEGQIELIENENLSSQIQQTTQPLDKAMLYAAAGLWENTLSVLVNLRRDRPNDSQVEKYWQDLLKSVDLKEVAQEPLLPCCTSPN
ncbi:DUF928 domain-containing protein [Chrysosporum bergii ANA360D]|jgi:tetratricopeptide (TPR) repeat protein|uniref:DUF928 domain-containing protein n=1 Tax=Chrysosporum bergii ANA360D TaxID=617107 RepID=A0AA43GPZ5_9CYAN|nr:DUF928 domain-containing protein [Chrysosporum bergii]MDH6059581.1 DUF928 domain-containing protein [Chrysosporum bergii ANA360D]